MDTLENLEETKGRYDYDSVVDEITKIQPRLAEQIYIEKRLEELKELMLELDLD